MKKYLALILTVVMAVSMFTACGKEAAPTEPATTEAVTTEAPNPLKDMSLEDILAAIYEEKAPEFPVMTTPVDLADENALRYCTGLTLDDAAKVKEAITSDAAMGSQAYSLVLLRVNDANDAEAIATAVKEGIDPRKWICVEADDLRASASGDVVMFIMVSTVFEESITAEQVTEAFKNVAGGNLSVDLK